MWPANVHPNQRFSRKVAKGTGDWDGAFPRTGLLPIERGGACAKTQTAGITTISHLNTPNIFIQTSSEFGDGQDFEHSKSIVFGCSGECDFGLDSRQRGEMFEPVFGCARDIVL